MACRGPYHLRCQCCGRRPSTRLAFDRDGHLLRFCDDCPSPSEIGQRKAMVRGSWKASTEQLRRAPVYRTKTPLPAWCEMPSGFDVEDNGEI